jgi:hypothetical protein
VGTHHRRRHQYGGLPEALNGDPGIYGRVYLSGYGRGVIYGTRLAADRPDDTDHGRWEEGFIVR